MSSEQPPTWDFYALTDPNDLNGFDLDAWLDEHLDEPAREELEPDYSSDEAAA